jgi:dTDP-glucose 4,6-dehydratase
MNNREMETILVTGGAGFIGGNFVLGLVLGGCVRVINLDALTYAGNMETLKGIQGDPNHVFVHGDIGDRKLVFGLLSRYQPSAVVNFAAETHVDRSIDAPAQFIRTNVVGTFELLCAVLDYWNGLSRDRQGTFRFLHVSTDEVYGSLGETGCFTEKMRYAPNSPYSASKAAADHLVRAYHHTYGLPVLTTHCSNNYGPYQFPEKLIPLMINNALQGKPLPVYGNGGNVRDWLYVEDHCKAVRLVLKAGRVGEVYNVGGNSEKTNLELVHSICAILDELILDFPYRPHHSLITFVADRPGHDRRYATDSTKLQTELGWSPEETLESGLRKTVQWYLNHREWTRRVLDGSYRGERLGLGRKA